jgi:hypothetical protein
LNVGVHALYQFRLVNFDLHEASHFQIISISGSR